MEQLSVRYQLSGELNMMSLEFFINGTLFIVAYAIEGRDLQILAVLPGARKWPGSLR